ncbi:MAG: hypothetical protein KAH20_11750 [Methylococcales bacterium]|nr:hypothetical protein [Methylococcales bacterium]
MSKHILVDGLFIYPTPIGCYYAVSSFIGDDAKNFINRLLKQPRTPALNIKTLKNLMNVESEKDAIELLHHCQNKGWIQGVKESIESPIGTLDTILPSLLDKVSETGNVLLSDEQGFHLACSGFTNETAEQLSAISAEIETIHERRIDMLANSLTIDSHAWAIVDAFGSSQLGFWPLFIGDSQFVITISGIPHFNRPGFVTLIWALSIRYQQI